MLRTSRRWNISDKTSSEQTKQQLESAFNLFNSMSLRLEEAYGELEAKVAALETELRVARLEREAQRAEKERIADRLAGLLAELPVGVVLVGRNGCIEQANRAAEDLLEGPLDGTALHDAIERSLSSSPDSAELICNSGRRITLTRRELDDGSCIVVLTDVSEVHDLQRRVARKERLAEMGEMAARLAHQIRTPVASAMLYASRLASTGDETGRRGAQKILERLRHLEATVNDMLVFAKGGSGQQQRLCLRELLCLAYRALDPRIQKNVRLKSRAAADMWISGNPETLAGALVNLVANAVQNGADDVVLGACAGTEGLVEIFVADNGPGVPAQIVEQIFDPFFTTRAGGTGLGLAVVRSEAEAMGGTVTVKNNPGGGATFILRLPAAAPLAAAVENYPQESPLLEASA